MNAESKIVRCHCGRLYTVYAYIVRDQSQCPRCEEKLRLEMEQQEKIGQKEQRP